MGECSVNSNLEADSKVPLYTVGKKRQLGKLVHQIFTDAEKTST